MGYLVCWTLVNAFLIEVGSDGLPSVLIEVGSDGLPCVLDTS